MLRIFRLLDIICKEFWATSAARRGDRGASRARNAMSEGSCFYGAEIFFLFSVFAESDALRALGHALEPPGGIRVLCRVLSRNLSARILHVF